MKNLEVPQLVNVNSSLVSEEERKSHILFNNLEQAMICIHYTNAVNYCIGISVENPYSNEGYFDINGFNNGKYDTELLLDKLYEDAKIFFETYSDRFTTMDENIIDYIIEEYDKYEFSRQFKYLTLLVEYLKSNKLSK